MMRMTFLVGLAVSLVLHTWLLLLPPRPPAAPSLPVVIPVIETALAEPTEPEPEPEITETPEPVVRQPDPEQIGRAHV